MDGGAIEIKDVGILKVRITCRRDSRHVSMDGGPSEIEDVGILKVEIICRRAVS